MTPWTAMIQAAVRLGIPPGSFWQLSLKEWRMLTNAIPQPLPLSRADLDSMIGDWPDAQDTARPAGNIAREAVAHDRYG